MARTSVWWASRPQWPWQGYERQVVDSEVNQWRARPRPATGRAEVHCASLAQQASILQERRGRCGGCGKGRLRSRGITALGVAVAAGSVYTIFVSDWEGWDGEAANGGRHRHRNHTHTTSKFEPVHASTVQSWALSFVDSPDIVAEPHTTSLAEPHCCPSNEAPSTYM